MKAQIATYLKVSENQIIEIREWAYVYFVRLAGCRPTFVSKKVVKTMSISPEKAVDLINSSFSFEDSRCRATLWQKHGKTRIYLKAIDRSRHLQDYGYISCSGGEFDYSEVRGFGSHREALQELLG